jgi:hypothetical protein
MRGMGRICRHISCVGSGVAHTRCGGQRARLRSASITSVIPLALAFMMANVSTPSEWPYRPTTAELLVFDVSFLASLGSEVMV